MGRTGRWTAGIVAVVAVLAVNAYLVGTLGTPPRPAATAAPAPGVPLLREVHLAGQHLSVLVTPQRPGANLVLVGGESGESGGVRVGAAPDTLTAAAARPGAAGQWAAVDLPPGPGAVWLEFGGERVPVAVDTGHGEPAAPGVAGPDGPECATAALGAALAGHAATFATCPADSLTAADRTSLRALVAFLAGRGIRALTLDADSSTRSAAAAAVVRDAAARSRVAVTTEAGRDNALVVVSGWATASTTLAAVAEHQRATVTFSAGTYLAPWLLSTPVLATTAGAVLPLRFDPRDEEPVRYQLAVATRFHGQYPTASGYQAWLSGGSSGAEPAGTRLYAAARVTFMPDELAAGHHHGQANSWLSGGTIVPVTGPLAT
jgi:hypothetical protein